LGKARDLEAPTGPTLRGVGPTPLSGPWRQLAIAVGASVGVAAVGLESVVVALAAVVSAGQLVCRVLAVVVGVVVQVVGRRVQV
jgi:hypothetical protein